MTSLSKYPSKRVPTLAFRFHSATMSLHKELAMSIDVEQLRNFQSRELEQPNLQTNGRQPVFSKTVEWSLLEIVILLTEIRDGINAVASKR